MKTCTMKFNFRNNFSLKTLLALVLLLTCFNLAHTRNFYDVTLAELRDASQVSEDAYNESRHYSVLNKYEDYVEQTKPVETKQFYASHNADYPAGVRLRDTIGEYGFYKLDKYNNIHHIEIKNFAIFKNPTLLLRKCDWFSLSSYAYSQDKVKEFCTEDFVKVMDDPVLSVAIKEELANETSDVKSNTETDYNIARNEAIFRFIDL